jgi:hypothetical protein
MERESSACTSTHSSDSQPGPKIHLVKFYLIQPPQGPMLRSELRAFKEVDKAIKVSSAGHQKLTAPPKNNSRSKSGAGIGAKKSTSVSVAPEPVTAPKVLPMSGKDKKKETTNVSPPKQSKSSKSGDKDKPNPGKEGNTQMKGKLWNLMSGAENDSTKSKSFTECRRKFMKKVVKSLTEAYSVQGTEAEFIGERLEKAICTAIDEDTRVSDTDTALRCYSNKMIELINEIKEGMVELQKVISKQEDPAR